MDKLDHVRTKLKEQVPLITHMGIDVISWDGSTVVVEAPLEPNLNTHGTAFGGSLYCVGAMTGWSALHLTLMDAGHLPSVWLAKGEVAYLKPVRGVLRAQTTITPEQRQQILEGYEGKGRVKTSIEVVIHEGDAEAVRMSALYAAMKQDP
ncbi:MAG: YiiD C-terminal domain-containing protein [Pseudomonadota bacterium]|nr:YiiD C-terminal domain-containing protein [Pseudomonadota bacterium]